MSTFYGGFDLMFQLFPVIFGLMFLLIAAIFVVALVKGISQWNSNNHSPVLTVDSIIVAKRTEVSRRHRRQGEMDTYSNVTSYYATFQFESGDRMELGMSGNEYGLLAEGDVGKVTFQGTRYLGFQREGMSESSHS